MATVAVNKKQVSLVVTAVVLTVTTLMGAIAWVDTRFEKHSAYPHNDALSKQEFYHWVEMQQKAQESYQKQVLQRLHSLEETIRSR